MPKYLVETISMHRMRYVVDCSAAGHAMDIVAHDEVRDEFSQKHIGESILSAREIDDAEYLRLFDEDNDYLSGWDDEQKFKFVHKVNYEEVCD